MRTSAARFAKQASERFLTAGNPTGLTGLFTHPAPRPALIAIYNNTLKYLQGFPKDSAYRASVEALTKHRLKIVESAVPEGYQEWASRIEKTHPELVEQARSQGTTLSIEPTYHVDLAGDYSWDGTGSVNEGKGEGPLEVSRPYTTGQKAKDARLEQAVNEHLARQAKASGEHQGIENEADRSAAVAKTTDQLTTAENAENARPAPEAEPPLTAEQISELEHKFGAGLIEEVVEVAEGELQLAAVMYENKVWEELVEKAPEGQWSYFERARHVKATQAPPQ